MGAAQLAGVLSIVGRQAAEAAGKPFDEEGDAVIREMVENQIEAESLASVTASVTIRTAGDDAGPRSDRGRQHTRRRHGFDYIGVTAA